ncbi:MAG: hypothetical protein A2295_03490 [Candidatus Jacksonbacteria bacterium RIFOXYB2_FULL_44_15]|nr:MAG: hypothetical protein A2295_03490 [Candidatus Jacksonbacteria bacterium RIFOXYB2_FULL_44_15]
MNRRLSIIIFCLVVGSGIFLPRFALAYTLQKLDIAKSGDFVLGPGKTELSLDPGDSVIQELYITNRVGERRVFKVEGEDFTGSDDPAEAIKLLGQERGPYSLKDYIKPEQSEFILEHGERMILPVQISIPIDAQPGGLYGSILVSTAPPKEDFEISDNVAAGQMKLVTRVGSLFFVRVKGEVVEDGVLESITMASPGKTVYESGPVRFRLAYRNRGSVYLTPYGKIEITNLLGKKIGEAIVDPWFVMPGSLRSREVDWDRAMLFGRYRAKASINRGYGDVIDQKVTVFWVIPWKRIALIAAIFTIISWFLLWLKSKIHFTINVSVKPAKLSKSLKTSSKDDFDSQLTPDQNQENKDEPTSKDTI